MAHYPETGQHRCYDVRGREIPCQGSGQDAELAPGTPWPQPRFLSRELTTVDRLTGLEWLRDANLPEWPMPWNEALRWVARANDRSLAGRIDWRLPNRRELRSLISHQARDPALPEGHPFRNVYLSWYWSSTSAARNPAYAWYVHMEGGRMFFGRKTEDHLVWPCRGRSPLLAATGQESSFDGHGDPAPGLADDGGLRCGVAWPVPRFRVHGEAVRDRLTGLLWTRCADLARGCTTCEDAYRVVADVRIDDLPWRLPTINELESLVDVRECDPSLPEEHPFTDVRDAYWSSTSSAYEPDWSMALYLDSGAVGVGQKKGRWFSVWAVAGGAGR